MDDVIVNKAEIIEKCILRVREEYGDDDKNLFEDLTKQDSIILNIQRACEASIDLAMHVIRMQKLGIPQESRDAFDLLKKEGIIDEKLSEKLKMMVGFRNIAVHDYKKLNLAIVKSIVKNEMDELKQFSQKLIKLLS